MGARRSPVNRPGADLSAGHTIKAQGEAIARVLKRGLTAKMSPMGDKLPDENVRHGGQISNVEATIARLYGAGYKMLPLGDGADGKKPLIGNWSAAKGCSPSTLAQLMGGAGSQMYGIRLDGLLVVDCDTDNPSTRNYVEQHFGLSPCMTRTSRGLHFWYRAGAYVPGKVRLPDISIDFKTGSGSFVVGPGSVRPDNGIVYTPAGAPLGFPASLPVFHAQPPQREVTARVKEGNRDGHLFRRAVEQALSADSEAEVFEELCAFRDIECENPESVTDSEIRAKARWAWRNRDRLFLMGGTNSTFSTNHRATAALASRPNSGDASLLYMVLNQNHGHRPGKVFTIIPDGLIAKGHLPCMSRNGIYRARDFLLSADLLEIVKLARPHSKEPHLYRLRLPGG